MNDTTAPTNDFLFDLLAGIGTPVDDPARDAYYDALFAHRDALHAAHMARGALTIARRTYGYGRRSDAAADALRAAERRLDLTPHPGPVPA